MKILVPLSDGFEEMEAVIIIDILRRGGVDVITAATGESQAVAGAHGIEMFADAIWSDVADEDFDGVAVPGGMGGTRRNQAHKGLLGKVAELNRKGKLVSAICAGPLVLFGAGVITAKTKFTCYPGIEAEMNGVSRLGDIVVADGNVVTSQGPGTTFAFAIALLRYLCGDAAADKVAAGSLAAL